MSVLGQTLQITLSLVLEGVLFFKMVVMHVLNCQRLREPKPPPPLHPLHRLQEDTANKAVLAVAMEKVKMGPLP